jgi:hypothetical protein
LKLAAHNGEARISQILHYEMLPKMDENCSNMKNRIRDEAAKIMIHSIKVNAAKTNLLSMIERLKIHQASILFACHNGVHVWS